MGHRPDEPKVFEVAADEVLKFVQDHFIEVTHKLGFRGQRCESWRLSPTLTRYIARLKQTNRLHADTSYHAVQRQLLQNFRNNVLTNRDLDPAMVDDEDLLWRFGQHHGLPTPLLDWTYSPYVGLFFALYDAHEPDPDFSDEQRCLWSLNIDLLKSINSQIEHLIWPKVTNTISPERAREEQYPRMEIVDHIDGYNMRLAYQQGFFTRHIYYESFEVWAELSPNLGDGWGQAAS